VIHIRERLAGARRFGEVIQVNRVRVTFVGQSNGQGPVLKGLEIRFPCTVNCAGHKHLPLNFPPFALHLGFNHLTCQYPRDPIISFRRRKRASHSSNTVMLITIPQYILGRNQPQVSEVLQHIWKPNQASIEDPRSSSRSHK
jgi:hypothetical protein